MDPSQWSSLKRMKDQVLDGGAQIVTPLTFPANGETICNLGTIYGAN
jgi:hypothetical protein